MFTCPAARRRRRRCCTGSSNCRRRFAARTPSRAENMTRLDTLQASLESVLGSRIKTLVRDRGELTLTVRADDYLAVAKTLRDDASLKFEQLVDLCGVDYSSYKDEPWDGP